MIVLCSHLRMKTETRPYEDKIMGLNFLGAFWNIIQHIADSSTLDQGLQSPKWK